MRVGIDATPLLGARSGVGRYVEGLLKGLRALGSPVDPVLTTFSLRGARPPAQDLIGATMAPRRLPARLLMPAWARSSVPPVEALTGRLDVFHGTNFLQPPSRARGVLTIHDLAFLHSVEQVTPGARAYRSLVPRGLRRARIVICFTEAVKQEIHDAYGIEPERIRVIPHGVDAAWSHAAALSPAQRDALGLPAQYLVALGTVEPRKNLGMLIAAHAQARRRNPATPPLALVGAAGWGSPWGEHAPDPTNVIMTGFVPDDLLPGLVAGARALCMPSHYEGFGLPVLEAMATGCPVLASDIPAHREVGGAAIRYVDRNVAAWADALLDPGDEPDAAATRRRSRAADFTWQRSARGHLDAYRDALA